MSERTKSTGGMASAMMDKNDILGGLADVINAKGKAQKMSAVYDLKVNVDYASPEDEKRVEELRQLSKNKETKAQVAAYTTKEDAVQNLNRIIDALDKKYDKNYNKMGKKESREFINALQTYLASGGNLEKNVRKKDIEAVREIATDKADISVQSFNDSLKELTETFKKIKSLTAGLTESGLEKLAKGEVLKGYKNPNYKGTSGVGSGGTDKGTGEGKGEGNGSGNGTGNGNGNADFDGDALTNAVNDMAAKVESNTEAVSKNTGAVEELTSALKNGDISNSKSDTKGQNRNDNKWLTNLKNYRNDDYKYADSTSLQRHISKWTDKKNPNSLYGLKDSIGDIKSADVNQLTNFVRGMEEYRGVLYALGQDIREIDPELKEFIRQIYADPRVNKENILFESMNGLPSVLDKTRTALDAAQEEIKEYQKIVSGGENGKLAPKNGGNSAKVLYDEYAKLVKINLELSKTGGIKAEKDADAANQHKAYQKLKDDLLELNPLLKEYEDHMAKEGDVDGTALSKAAFMQEVVDKFNTSDVGQKLSEGIVEANAKVVEAADGVDKLVVKYKTLVDVNSKIKELQKSGSFEDLAKVEGWKKVKEQILENNHALQKYADEVRIVNEETNEFTYAQMGKDKDPWKDLKKEFEDYLEAERKAQEEAAKQKEAIASFAGEMAEMDQAVDKADENEKESAQVVVEAEEKKQEAIRETTDAINEQEKTYSAFLVNMNTKDALREGGSSTWFKRHIKDIDETIAHFKEEKQKLENDLTGSDSIKSYKSNLSKNSSIKDLKNEAEMAKEYFRAAEEIDKLLSKRHSLEFDEYLKGNSIGEKISDEELKDLQRYYELQFKIDKLLDKEARTYRGNGGDKAQMNSWAVRNFEELVGKKANKGYLAEDVYNFNHHKQSMQDRAALLASASGAMSGLNASFAKYNIKDLEEVNELLGLLEGRYDELKAIIEGTTESQKGMGEAASEQAGQAERVAQALNEQAEAQAKLNNEQRESEMHSPTEKLDEDAKQASADLSEVETVLTRIDELLRSISDQKFLDGVRASGIENLDIVLNRLKTLQEEIERTDGSQLFGNIGEVDSQKLQAMLAEATSNIKDKASRIADKETLGLGKLYDALTDVIAAIMLKNSAFEEEAKVVKNSVNAEKGDLSGLANTVKGINKYIEESLQKIGKEAADAATKVENTTTNAVKKTMSARRRTELTNKRDGVSTKQDNALYLAQRLAASDARRLDSLQNGSKFTPNKEYVTWEQKLNELLQDERVRTKELNKVLNERNKTLDKYNGILKENSKREQEQRKANQAQSAKIRRQLGTAASDAKVSGGSTVPEGLGTSRTMSNNERRRRGMAVRRGGNSDAYSLQEALKASEDEAAKLNEETQQWKFNLQECNGNAREIGQTMRSFANDAEKATEATKQQSQATDGATKSEKELQALEKRRATLMTKMAKLNANISKTYERNSAYGNTARSALRGYMEELERGGKLGSKLADLDELENVDARLKQIAEDFNRIQAEEAAAGRSGRSFFGNMANQLTHLNAQFIAMYFSWMDWVRYARQGLETIRELDSALAEMNKVSDETMTSLKNFQKESYGLADAIGTTGLQLQQSTADFMRLGKSLSEGSQFAQAANILKNVSEFTDISEATDAIISATQAYNEIPVMDIIDELNNIGNNYSISTEQLATGLQNVAGVMSTQGNTLEETLALITAGNAIDQDVSKASRGVRMIALRIAGTEEAKQELADLGEDVDDFVVQTKAKMRDLIMDYTKAAGNEYKGVDILDANGNYRSTYEMSLICLHMAKAICYATKVA